MNTSAKRNMSRLITQLKDDPIARIVLGVLTDMKKESKDGPSVVEDPDHTIRQALAKAGYVVVDEKLKVRHKVEILVEFEGEPKKSMVIAMGISDSPDDALAQALHGYLKEQEMVLRVA